MEKKCYRNSLYTATVVKNDKLFDAIMDEALNDFSKTLTNMVNSYDSRDLPLLVGSMKMVCRNLESAMSKSEIALMKSFEKDVTSIAAFKPRNGGNQ